MALSACKKDLSDITDEQLIALLGDGGAPAQITTNTRECAEILGGINGEVYQDMPEDMLGMMKTDCRKTLQGWLDDPERNGTELSLEDFEHADLAERIVALDDAQEAARAEQRKAEDAAKIEAMKAELAEAAAAAEALKAGLRERHDRMIAICARLADLRGKLDVKKDELSSIRARNDIAMLAMRYPSACRTEEPFSMQFTQIARFEERLADFELPEPGDRLSFISVPSLRNVSLETIDDQISKTEALAAEYQAELAEN
ncbi:MAG: hypothetical protein AAF950_18690 [Pseudomonadota bacterium]